MVLNNDTPADRAGIKINGNNKWITLIQNASRKSSDWFFYIYAYSKNAMDETSRDKILSEVPLFVYKTYKKIRSLESNSK